MSNKATCRLSTIRLLLGRRRAMHAACNACMRTRDTQEGRQGRQSQQLATSLPHTLTHTQRQRERGEGLQLVCTCIKLKLPFFVIPLYACDLQYSSRSDRNLIPRPSAVLLQGCHLSLSLSLSLSLMLAGSTKHAWWPLLLLPMPNANASKLVRRRLLLYQLE